MWPFQSKLNDGVQTFVLDYKEVKVQEFASVHAVKASFLTVAIKG